MKKKLPVLVFVLALAGCSWLNKPQDFEPTGIQFALNPAVPVECIIGEAPWYNPNGWTTIGLAVRGDSAAWAETLPGGLFFRAKSKSVQNIILLKRHIIRGVPYDTVFPIGGFCVNSTRDLPGTLDTFELGPVTDNRDIKRLVDAVADKDIRYGAAGWLQLAVWEVTEGGKLSDYWLDSIANLPPDTGGLAPNRRPGRHAEKLQYGRGR